MRRLSLATVALEHVPEALPLLGCLLGAQSA